MIEIMKTVNYMSILDFYDFLRQKRLKFHKSTRESLNIRKESINFVTEQWRLAHIPTENIFIFYLGIYPVEVLEIKHTCVNGKGKVILKGKDPMRNNLGFEIVMKVIQ